MEKGRIRKYAIVFVMFIIFVMQSVLVANAHSVELDPNSLIDFPMMITNGKGTFTIKDTSNYSLYYQGVEISDSVYEQIEQIEKNGKTEKETLASQRDSLKTEYENLLAAYNEKVTAYNNLVKNGGSESEIAAAKTAYETAQTVYETKRQEYLAKFEEWRNSTTVTQNRVHALIPTYVEANWKQTSDKSFQVDLSQFSGDKVFAIWAKLVSGDGTISYDVTIYTFSGTKSATVAVQSITLSDTEKSIVEGSSYSLSVTYNPTNATDKSTTWTSDNEKVATVSGGRITAVSVGTANITAKCGNATATCKVTVTAKGAATTGSEETPQPQTPVTPKSDPDESVATTVLPFTGKIKLFGITVAIGIFGFVMYRNYRKLDF